MKYSSTTFLRQRIGRHGLYAVYMLETHDSKKGSNACVMSSNSGIQKKREGKEEMRRWVREGRTKRKGSLRETQGECLQVNSKAFVLTHSPNQFWNQLRAVCSRIGDNSVHDVQSVDRRLGIINSPLRRILPNFTERSPAVFGCMTLPEHARRRKRTLINFGAFFSA